MEKDIKKIIVEIQRYYRKGYGLKTDKEIFNHLLKQIEKHIIKLSQLKADKDKFNIFKREIADMYLLSLGLIELEKIDEEVIKASANYYLNKVRKNSEKLLQKIKEDIKNNL